jgi:hypothetical protein
MSSRPHGVRVQRIKDLVASLPRNSGINRDAIIANVGVSTHDESYVLDDIFSIFDAFKPENVSEIFRGAHVVVSDGGVLYRRWRFLNSAEDRKSSHESNDQQYEVAGPCCHAILVGTWGPHTWFQMENHAWGGDKVDHLVDWANYVASSHNQGPYGSSKYTEDHALWIAPMTDDD